MTRTTGRDVERGRFFSGLNLRGVRTERVGTSGGSGVAVGMASEETAPEGTAELETLPESTQEQQGGASREEKTLDRLAEEGGVRGFEDDGILNDGPNG